ncbi:MAG: FRG domain-containing protein [Alphaproteobacteria bacterium]
MKGQWYGWVYGATPGKVLLDLDQVGEVFAGSAYLIPDDHAMPATLAEIRTPDGGLQHDLTVPTVPIHRGRRLPMSFQELTAQYPTVVHAAYANVSLKLIGPELRVSFTAPTGAQGTGRLLPSRATEASEIKPESRLGKTNDLLDLLRSFPKQQYIFRGQSVPKRLRTSFHRRNRYDLRPYLNHAIPQLTPAVAAATGHTFHFDRPGEFGAFMNLVQHHGFPTPLLDWTNSPYVAAYFAFADAKQDQNYAARLFALDRDAWCTNVPQFDYIAYDDVHFSVVDLLNIGNIRQHPQQAVATLTNVDDIETYIRQIEADKGRRFLRVYDLEPSLRSECLTELDVMGVHAASLFPGLDGVCEQMKNRIFGY